MDHQLFVPSDDRSCVILQTFGQMKTVSASLCLQSIDMGADVDSMRSSDNNLSESGWTMYLDQSSWTGYKNAKHLHPSCKEASGITGNEEKDTDSSMASDASSGPQQQQFLPLPGHEQDHVQPGPHESCPSRKRGLHQDLEWVASCSSREVKPRKNKIIRVDRDEASLLQDTASSKVYVYYDSREAKPRKNKIRRVDRDEASLLQDTASSKSGLVEGEFNGEEKQVVQGAAESLVDIEGKKLNMRLQTLQSLLPNGENIPREEVVGVAGVAIEYMNCLERIIQPHFGGLCGGEESKEDMNVTEGDDKQGMDMAGVSSGSGNEVMYSCVQRWKAQ